jgi:hypothetical protein
MEGIGHEPCAPPARWLSPISRGNSPPSSPYTRHKLTLFRPTPQRYEEQATQHTDHATVSPNPASPPPRPRTGPPPRGSHPAQPPLHIVEAFSVFLQESHKDSLSRNRSHFDVFLGPLPPAICPRGRRELCSSWIERGTTPCWIMSIIICSAMSLSLRISRAPACNIAVLGLYSLQQPLSLGRHVDAAKDVARGCPNGGCFGSSIDGD